MDHRAKDRLLENSECRFLFIERDRANAEALTGQVGGFGRLPGGIDVRVECGEAFEVLRAEVDALKSAGQNMAPAFIFVDPYGFSLPGDLLAELMAFKRVELFVNVMWRELDMAMSQEPAPGHGQAAILDQLLGPDSWRSIDGDSMVERADEAAALLADRVGARWWTHTRMVSGGGAVRFFLLHLTNHDAGRDLMKECLWKVCPGGDMMVRRSDNPDQFVLIEEKPDLAPLREWLLERLQDEPVAEDVLRQELRGMIWTWGHLRGVESDLESRGKVERLHGRLSLPMQKHLSFDRGAGSGRR